MTAPRLFDVRRVPLAEHARRDWLDVLRGDLPKMAPPMHPRRGSVPLLDLYFTGVARGLAIGAGTGAVAGSLLAPILGTAIGAAVGLFVALPISLLLSGAITALAALRHRPLRQPRRLHREIWAILLVGVAVLDAVPIAVAAVKVQAVPWRLAGTWLLILTATIVWFLRGAARGIVFAYARASGWRLARKDCFSELPAMVVCGEAIPG